MSRLLACILVFMHYKRCCYPQKQLYCYPIPCCYQQKTTISLSYSSHKSQVGMSTVSCSIFSCGLLPLNPSSLLALLPSTLSSFFAPALNSSSLLALLPSTLSSCGLLVHYWSCSWLVGLNEGRVWQGSQLLI